MQHVDEDPYLKLWTELHLSLTYEENERSTKHARVLDFRITRRGHSKDMGT